MTRVLDVLRRLTTTTRGATLLAITDIWWPDPTVAADFQAIYDQVARRA